MEARQKYKVRKREREMQQIRDERWTKLHETREVVGDRQMYTLIKYSNGTHMTNILHKYDTADSFSTENMFTSEPREQRRERENFEQYESCKTKIETNNKTKRELPDTWKR